MKRLSIYLAFVLFTGLAAKAQKSEVYVDDGNAIHGFDAVAFFTEHKPVKGTASFAYVYKGANWLFSSQQNLEAFKRMPDSYAPQYGGYCAYGAAQGHKAPTEADTWSIVNGKLYFNYNSSVKKKWVEDQAAMIMKANANWPGIKDKE